MTTDGTPPPSPAPAGPPALPPLSPLARLDRLVEALSARLPDGFRTLLAADRFSGGAAALARLGDRSHRAAALGALAPAEADWLAAELASRWQRLAPGPLPAAVAIAAPAEIALGDGVQAIPVALQGEGILPGWTAQWHGAEATADGATAKVMVPPSPGTDVVSVRVHVRARQAADGSRCVLVADATIRLRPSEQVPGRQPDDRPTRG
jgi:hypothetical protein